MTPRSESSTREERLHELLLGYVEAVERGEGPDRGEFLARHPEFAAELADFFAGQDRFDSLAAGVRTPALPIPPACLPTGVPALSFGDYEVLEELGRGGMGVVFKARQCSLPRTVALKMILPGRFASAAEVARFRAEAETIGTLDHPHIVPVHAVGEYEGQPFFVMKLVEGGTLARRMTEFRDPKAAAALLAKVARAVHYAHQHGVIHRDLKPSNVLLDPSGEPCVGDFGLAKRLTSAGNGSAATPSGAVIGTPNYIAPEQAAGRKTGLTTSDIYSLGAVLYELLTGRPPFQAETPVETLLQVIEREPERPRSLNRRLDRDLETVCLKCLDKDPRKRYGSAEALAEDLERWLRREPVRARRAGTAERLWRWCRRNPALAAAAVSIAGLLVAIAVITTSLATLWLHERNDALRAEGKAQRRLYDAKLEAARSARWSGRPGQRLSALAALAEAARLVPELSLGPDAVLELRNEAIACLTLCDLRLDEQWSLPEYQGYGLAIDPRLERYAFSDGEGNILVRRTGDHQEIARLEGIGAGHHAYQLRFSPDGKYLAALHHDHWKWRVWDLSRNELLIRWACAGGLDFTPDGRGVALAREDGSIRFLDLTSGAEVRRFASGLRVAEAIFLDPTGRRLAASCNQEAALATLDVESGKLLRKEKTPPGLTAAAWSPNGGRLATAFTRWPVWVWDVETGRMVVVCTGHQGSVQQLAFDRDGELLVGSDEDDTVRLWDARTGRQLLSSPGGGAPLQFSPDYQRLALARNGLVFGTWRVSVSREFTVLRSEQGDGLTAEGLSVSPDGRLLASPHKDGFRLWDLAAGKEVAFLPCRDTTSAEFHPGGDLITDGPKGICRWPIRPDPDQLDGLQIGPPRSLGLPPAVAPGSRMACLFPDGRTVSVAVANGNPGEVVALDLELGTQRSLLRGVQHLRRLAVSPDGGWVATVPYWFPAQRITVWDARTGDHVRDLDRVVNGSATFSPDGKWLVAGIPNEFHFWETGTWTLARVLPRIQSGGGFGNAAFSPDGRLLALSISRHEVQLRDPATGRELALFQSPEPMSVTRPCFNPNGSRLAVATEGQGIQSWDLRLIRQQLAEIGLDWDLPPYPLAPAAEDGTPLRVRPGPEGELRRFDGHKGPVASAAFLPDGRRALSAGRDGTLRLWDLATGKELHRCEGHVGGVVGLAVSADGRVLSGGHDHAVRLGDVETGRELKRFTGHTDVVWCVAFSPDGRQALSYGKDCTIRRWDLETGEELWCSQGPAPPPVVGRVAYFPDGERALSVRDKTVRLWDLKAGQELRRFDDRPEVVIASALLPTGRFLLGDTAGKVWLMDAEDGKELRTFSGHQAVISGVAFSHDGRRALSGSLDGTVCLWDLETGASLRTFKASLPGLHGVAISPDGRRALTASGDGVLRLWDLDGGR
jgi:WD40 repeat protein